MCWEGGQEPTHGVWRNPARVGGVEHRRHHRAFIDKAADAALRRGERERALKSRQHTTPARLGLRICQQPIQQIDCLRQQGCR
jgi:hypothetical protein